MKNVCFRYNLGSIILLCVLVVNITARTYNDDDFNKGMIFLPESTMLLTGDKWTLGIDIDLVTYSKLIKTFRDKVDNIANFNVAQIPDAFAEFASGIKSVMDIETTYLIQKAEQATERLSIIHDTIAPQDHRSKRSIIDGVGHVMRFLFGTMDTKDLERINVRFSALTQGQQAIGHLMTEQVSFIKEGVRRIEHNTADIQKIDRLVGIGNAKVRNLELQLRQVNASLQTALSYTFGITSMYRRLEATIVDIMQEIEQLKEAITEIASGHLSTYFLSPRKLLKILTSIQPHLAIDLQLITNLRLDEMYIYFNTVAVHAVSYNTVLRIYVEIPLKAPNRFFELYKTAPLPLQINNLTTAMVINPTHPYFAITPDRQMYIEFLAQDMSECTTGTIRVCPPLTAVYRRGIPSCLSALFLGNEVGVHKLCEKIMIIDIKPVFYRSEGSNIWIYSVERMKLWYQCQTRITGPGDETKQIEITGTGRLTLPSNCYVQGPELSLMTHSSSYTSYNNTVLNVHVPPITNILLRQTTSKTLSSSVGEPDEIDKVLKSIRDEATPPLSVPYAEWMEKLEALKPKWYQPKQENLSYHISFGFGLLVLIALIITVCKRKLIYNKVLNFKKRKMTAVNISEPYNVVRMSAPEAVEIELDQMRPLTRSIYPDLS